MGKDEPGWYYVGSGQLRYMDSDGWTEEYKLIDTQPDAGPLGPPDAVKPAIDEPVGQGAPDRLSFIGRCTAAARLLIAVLTPLIVALWRLIAAGYRDASASLSAWSVTRQQRGQSSTVGTQSSSGAVGGTGRKVLWYRFSAPPNWPALPSYDWLPFASGQAATGARSALPTRSAALVDWVFGHLKLVCVVAFCACLVGLGLASKHSNNVFDSHQDDASAAVTASILAGGDQCTLQAWRALNGRGTVSTVCKNYRDPLYGEKFADWQDANARQHIWQMALPLVAVASFLLLGYRRVYRNCPHCRGRARQTASACPHCTRAIEPTAAIRPSSSEPHDPAQFSPVLPGQWPLLVLGIGLVILLAVAGLSVAPLCLLLAAGLACWLWYKWPLTRRSVDKRESGLLAHVEDGTPVSS